MSDRVRWWGLVGVALLMRGAVIRDGATVDSIVRAARTVSAQIGAARPTSIAAQATFSGRF